MWPFLWQSVLYSLVGLFASQMQFATSLSSDVDGYVAYVGSEYVAEASIARQLYSVKSEDVYAADKVRSASEMGKTADQHYGTVNGGADAGYFDVSFLNAPKSAADLGEISGGDVTARSVPTSDSFNQFALDYGSPSWSTERIEMTVLRSPRSFGSRCSFGDYSSWSCSDVSKYVVYTGDATQNGVARNGYVARFQAGENGYASRVFVEGLQTDSYDYRITFSTISGRAVPMAYRAYRNGEERKIVNNIVEIDTVGTAIDNFARLKLQKNVSDEISPLGKYVLFSDSEVAK